MMIWLLLTPKPRSGSAWEGEVRFTKVGSLAGPVDYENIEWKLDILAMAREATGIAHHIDKTVDDFLQNRTWATSYVQHFKTQLHPLLGELKAEARQLKDVVMQLREKRALGIAMAVMGAVAAVGSVIYTVEQVHRLSVNSQKQAHNIALNHRAIEKLRDVIFRIVMQEEHALQELETLSDMRWELNTLIRRVRQAKVGVQSLLRNQIPLGLLNEDDLALARKDLDGMSKKYQLIFSPEESLLKAPISWLMNGTTLKIFFHVPAVRNPRLMIRDLYRLEGGVLSHATGVVKFMAPEPYISVTTDYKVHAPLTNSDLDLCHKIGPLYLCDHMNILYTASHSCVAALFYKDTTLATKMCHLEHQAETADVVKISSDLYLFGKGQKLVYLCGSMLPKIKRLPNITEMRVSTECEARGDDYTIYPQRTVARSYVKVKHSLDWRTIMHSSNVKLEGLRMQLLAIGKEKMLSWDDDSFPFIELVIFGLLITVAFLGILSYWWIRRYRRDLKGQRRSVKKEHMMSLSSGEFVKAHQDNPDTICSDDPLDGNRDQRTGNRAALSNIAYLSSAEGAQMRKERQTLAQRRRSTLKLHLPLLCRPSTPREGESAQCNREGGKSIDGKERQVSFAEEAKEMEEKATSV